MNPLLNLSDADLLESAELSDAEFDMLESELALRAACLATIRELLGSKAQY